MIKVATVVLGATLGLAALGHTDPAAAGVSVGVGVGRARLTCDALDYVDESNSRIVMRKVVGPAP